MCTMEGWFITLGRIERPKELLPSGDRRLRNSQLNQQHACLCLVGTVCATKT